MIEKLNDEDILSDTRIIPKINEIIDHINGEKDEKLTVSDLNTLINAYEYYQSNVLGGNEYTIRTSDLYKKLTRMKGKS